MIQSVFHRGRSCALAPAALLLLALCLLAGSAQAIDVPRFVVGDVLETSFANATDHLVIARVDTTSVSVPLYRAYHVEQDAGRWVIPRYWHQDLEYTEESLATMHARRVAHVDPVRVIITDRTITGGDTLYYGLSLAEAKAGVTYAIEPAPGESSGLPNVVYVVGDILGNVTDPDRGSVVASVYESDGTFWFRVYSSTVRSGDRWMIEKYYNNDMAFTASMLDQYDMRRVAHADPHTVIVNDTTTNTGDIGWYRLSLAEVKAGKSYDWMGNWHYNTGDILANGTATRYIVGNATVSDTGPSHYTLYEAVRSADGWEIPDWVNAGIPLALPLGVPHEDLAYDLVDHVDPHFAIVTDPSVANGLTFNGLSLGEILEGTPGYPPESPGPIGGDTGYFLVSTVPAGAQIYLEDISGTRYLKGTTGAGPLNVTVYLTGTPIRAIVATLPGYREAVHTVTQYPPKGVTFPVSLTLVPAAQTAFNGPHAVPGRIQAEDYDNGGEGVAYHDTTPGNTGGAHRHDDVDIETGNGVTNVGWIREGEQLKYTVNVSQPGFYQVSLRVATPNSGRSVEVSADGGRPITYWLPNTGSFGAWATTALGSTPCPNTWMTVTQTPTPTATGIENQPIPISLSAGTHVIALAFHGDGQNLDWIEIAPCSTTPPPTGQPYPGPHPVPGRVEAEDYDTGGYADTTPANEGGAYRQDAVDIERGGSNYNVGWIRPGEYLEYSVDTSSANNYNIAFRVANPGPAKTVTVRINGAAKTLAIPSTGSFATWQTATVYAGWIPAGRNTVRVESGSAGSFNLDHMQFAQGGTITTPTTPVPSGGASFTAAPLSAPKGSAVRFTVTPASGKTIKAAWWSFDAAAHLNTWNSRATNPTFYYPAKGTFSPLVKLTYADGSTETVQRTNYVTAT